MVFTMAYARNKGIWPRTEPPPDPPEPPPDPPPPPPDPPEPPPEQGAISAEGVLKSALTELWEKVRAAKADRVSVLTIRMFEVSEAFKLLGVVRTISGAEKLVTMRGGYETAGGAEFEMEFQGPVPDAEPVKEFLSPQLRDATVITLEVEFELTFAEGLSMDGDTTEKLTGQLSRFVSGAAHVEAEVKTES